MSVCKSCSLEIFWNDVNGKMLPFEDQTFTIFHNCPNLSKKNLNTNNDHILLTQTISRMSSLERIVAELENRMRTENEV